MEEEVLLDTQRSFHDESTEVFHLIHREGLSIAEPIDNKVIFDNEVVILEDKNIFKNKKLFVQLLSSMISLLLLGLNDQILGSLLEFFLEDYQLNRFNLSYLFIAQFCGYIPASVLNNYLMRKYGLYKLYAFCCILVSFASIFFILKSPFPVLIVCSSLFGWSNGSFDCCLNYFIGTLDYSNELLGIMHSMYGFGCLITPILSINLINKFGMKWNHYYYSLFFVSIINLILVLFFFQNETSSKYRYDSQNNEDVDDEPTLLQSITNKYIIFFSFSLFVYVGSELSVGIWLNNYMFKIQNLSLEKASNITSLFWLFMTLGRGVMGFITGRFFQNLEIKCIILYCFLVALNCFFFWLFKYSIIIQTICICLAGWFIGPLFSTTIIISLKSLPKKFSIKGISLIAGFGGTGAAIIPSIMGYISEHFGKSDGNEDINGAGLKYFPEYVSITFFLAFMLWFLFYLFNKSIYDNKLRLT